MDEDGITCPSCDSEWARNKAEAEIEYLRDKAKSKLPAGAKIILIDKIDELKSGQWWLWCCDVEMPDGSTAHGTVRGNGHETDSATLEIDP